MRRSIAFISILILAVFAVTACAHTSQNTEATKPAAEATEAPAPAAEATEAPTPAAEAGNETTPAAEAAEAPTPAAEATEAPAPAAEKADATEETEMNETTGTFEAVYLGVLNYGAEETNKDNKDDFSYRFEIDGGERIFKVDNGTKNAEGKYDYTIQNSLKEGYAYTITVEDGKVVATQETEAAQAAFTPVVQGTPGEKTLANFLRTALEPVGTTLYIYGGGWDWQDEGSAVQARMFGVSPDWVRFFGSKDENYTFKAKDGNDALKDPATSYYPYGGYNEYYYAGLDCSGFVGWALYNTMETEELQEGYVGGATGFAKRLAAKGWGTWTQDIKAPDGQNGYEMKPGDIMSINGHVWVSLGTCEDGSVVIIHSTPSKSRAGQPGGGVQISAIGTSESCEGYVLADKYMSEFYPEWYGRYPIYLCDPEVYFGFTGENAGRFSWDAAGGGALADPDGLQKMRPEEVLEFLFE